MPRTTRSKRSSKTPSAPSFSPLTGAQVQKRAPKRPTTIRLGTTPALPSFAKPRLQTRKHLEEKVQALLDENNRLKNWWWIDMQYRPEQRDRSLDGQWHVSENMRAEHWRQAIALAGTGWMGKNEVIGKEHAEEVRVLKVALVGREEEMEGVRKELEKAREEVVQVKEEALQVKKEASETKRLLDRAMDVEAKRQLAEAVDAAAVSL